MFNYSPNKEIREFLKIYPDIIQSIDIEETHKFLPFFKKPESTNLIDSPIKRKNTFAIIRMKSRKSLDFNRNKNTKNERRRISCKNYNENTFANSSQNSFDENLYEQEINNILNKNRKNNINNKELNENSEVQNIYKDDNYFLIKKGLFLQSYRKSRTPDVKKSLELFLFNSKFMEKMQKNLFIQYKKYNNKKRIENR